MTMFRAFDFLMIALMIGMAVWTFKIKHDSQIALDRVAELESRIAAEKTEIDLLKSDWSLLTSPARLQDLVEKYGGDLKLHPMEPSQLASENDLPGYRHEVKPGASPMFDGFVEADRGITTGSLPVESKVDE